MEKNATWDLYSNEFMSITKKKMSNIFMLWKCKLYCFMCSPHFMFSQLSASEIHKKLIKSHFDHKYNNNTKTRRKKKPFRSDSKYSLLNS